ncbi:MAG: hypothetical protein CL928_14605 [Deltaproteobacteria bacterium]|nr:hypothetical protein [Deltaproteobacteria bacterium]|tara:strand:+ start:286 stop:738 length:453 start_codon:yes stop_codon:yes gene_type:complete
MITRQDIEDAQSSWGAAVVALGTTTSPEEARREAVALVEKHYLLDDGSLLFCPTKAAEQQFRTNLEEAVSYFVGQGLPEDKGFALQPWTSVRFENAGTVCRDGLGIAMGNYFFGQSDGSELKVEYSFIYVRDQAGQIKIQLHHSALPYSG